MPTPYTFRTCRYRKTTSRNTLTLLTALLLLSGAALGADNAEPICKTPAACTMSATELAALGRQLNTQGRYQEAAEHLERALMLDPSLKDAQLSYAIALVGSGDLPSANALLTNLLADPELPAPLRALISNQQRMLQAQGTPPANTADPHAWQHRLSLSLRAGLDSNILGAPNLGSLALTLPGQTVVLPLAESYLAQKGSYLRTDALLTLRRTLADGTRWDIATNLRSRYSPSVPQAGSTQTDLFLERSQTSTHGHYLNASASNLNTQSNTHYQTWGAAVGWANTGRCQTRAGAEWQKRNYRDNTVLSGRYIGMAAFISCDSPKGEQWLLGLKAGQDTPQNTARPGGAQQLSSLRVAGYLPLAPVTGALLLDIELSWQHDSASYSPLIESGLARRMTRQVARVEYQRQTTPAVQWVLGTEWVDQRSNLPIFGQRSWGGYTAVRMAW